MRRIGQDFISPRRHIRRSERGGSLVELVIALPLVMSLLLGLFTGGAAYTRKIALVEAVREGTRYGMSLLVPTGAGGVTTWETDVRNRVVGASAGELSSGDVCVKLVLATGGADCGVIDPPGASSEPGVHLVKASVSKPATIQFFFFSISPTLSSGLAVRYQRDAG